MELTESTKEINKINYNSALTFAISEILSSKKIILMASGKSKAKIIYEFINSTVPRNDLPVSYLLNHPNVELYVDNDAFSDMLNLSPTFMKYNKILIFSPHPDDDVIGMGVTIKKFIELNKDVTIVYQTSGANGGNIITRQDESINALKILGLNDKTKIIFGNTPFYNKNNIDNIDNIDNINNIDDINYTLDIIQSINPDVIFFAGDICDPHKTHLICNNIVKQCVRILSNIDAYNYYSVWYSPPCNEYCTKEYFTKNLMDLKIESIKAHKSQLNPIFIGELDTEFYNHIEKRNKCDSQQSFSDIYLEGFTERILYKFLR